MCIFLKHSAAELPVLSSHIQRFFPLNMDIPDILLCDHFFPKFCFALNNSPSDEILPTECLILWSLEHVSHLKSYKCDATVTRSSFWCNCCYYVEFFFVLSSLFCLFTQLTPDPPPMSRDVSSDYVTASLAHFAGEEMRCGSAPLSKPLINSTARKLSVISAPLTPSGPECWSWGTRVWTSKLQHQLPPNQHWVETPAQVLRWPDHIWVCGEQSGEPSPPKCNEDEGDGGGFLLSPDVYCGADVEIVQNYRLEWSTSTEAVYKKSLSRLYFCKRFRSLSLRKQMLQMLYSCGENHLLRCAGLSHQSEGRQQTE